MMLSLPSGLSLKRRQLIASLRTLLDLSFSAARQPLSLLELFQQLDLAEDAS
jgi:hypothetical protein